MKNSPLRWYGGKRRLLKYVLPFPQHKNYIELFGGSAVVLLNKVPSVVEIYNDNNSNLVNFWKVLMEEWEKLKSLCSMQIPSRDLFDDYVKRLEENRSRSRIHAAMQFFYVNAFSFSGNNQDFCGWNVDKVQNGYGKFFNTIERIKEVHGRIKKVRFENQDFRKILNRALELMDLKTTLIYADPPYYKGGDWYVHGVGGNKWSEKHFKDLWYLLSQFNEAKIIVSIDKPDVLRGWNVQQITRTNSAARRNRDRKVEYILRNYNIDKVPQMKEEEQLRLEGFIK
jgi:DNA adenine methylase